MCQFSAILTTLYLCDTLKRINCMYNDNDEKTPIMPIFAEISGSLEDDVVELKTEDLPILTLRNMVLFPHVAMPVLIGRKKTLRLIKEAQRKRMPIGVTCQIDADVEDPTVRDLYPIGVVAEVLKIQENVASLGQCLQGADPVSGVVGTDA
ncbi:MAG: LON peptidase substrate-binding domain-containing protein, partial [Bacteroidaceae bacterium]|nr:LON peptidase substrate-binding domain-containing protein [Bacteroidaceae bacterium]